MHEILTKGHVRGAEYTHADVDAMPSECYGCETGHARRLPFKGTHDAAARGDRDVVVYADAFGKTRTAAHGGYH